MAKYIKVYDEDGNLLGFEEYSGSNDNDEAQ